jgi:hypothetical protein
LVLAPDSGEPGETVAFLKADRLAMFLRREFDAGAIYTTCPLRWKDCRGHVTVWLI